MKVDVAVLTKNSQEHLQECLDAIYRNVPVSRLIVVDGYSTDKTLEIVEEFNNLHRNIRIIQDEGTRGRARQVAIEAIETDWFMFVDSDAILCDKWFEEALKLVEDGVGAVWGIEIWSAIRNPLVLKLFKQTTMKIFETRGGTHDLLVRRQALQGIRIPDDLHVFEDTYIKNWITRKGYKVVAAYLPYCIHKRPLNVWTPTVAVRIATNEIRQGLFQKYPQLLPSYAFYVGYFFYQLLRTVTKKLGQTGEPILQAQSSRSPT